MAKVQLVTPDSTAPESIAKELAHTALAFKIAVQGPQTPRQFAPDSFGPPQARKSRFPHLTNAEVAACYNNQECLDCRQRAGRHRPGCSRDPHNHKR